MTEKEKNELLSKYSITLDGYNRIYKIHLDSNFHNLECCTPLKLQLEDIIIENSSWSNLLTELTIILHKKFKDIDFLNFVPSWREYHPFNNKCLNNFWVEIDENLYLYRNFDSDHAYRYMYELCKYCLIDTTNSSFYIHRSPFAEPDEIVNEFSAETKEEFKKFLKIKYQLETRRCDKIIDNIDKYMNSILSKLSKSYNNWFLFTDRQYVINYVSRFDKYLNSDCLMSDKSKRIMTRYLQYLNNFYKVYLK